MDIRNEQRCERALVARDRKDTQIRSVQRREAVKPVMRKCPTQPSFQGYQAPLSISRSSFSTCRTMQHWTERKSYAAFTTWPSGLLTAPIKVHWERAGGYDLEAVDLSEINCNLNLRTDDLFDDRLREFKRCHWSQAFRKIDPSALLGIKFQVGSFSCFNDGEYYHRLRIYSCSLNGNKILNRKTWRWDIIHPNTMLYGFRSLHS